MTGGVRSADGLLVPVVAETLVALAVGPEDAAVARLAELYARELDKASAIAAQAERVLKAVGDDAELGELVGALKAKLAARVALESLGPKLLSALESLGATPKARSATSRGGAPRGGDSKLAALRATRNG